MTLNTLIQDNYFKMVSFNHRPKKRYYCIQITFTYISLKPAKDIFFISEDIVIETLSLFEIFINRNF